MCKNRFSSKKTDVLLFFLATSSYQNLYKAHDASFVIKDKILSAILLKKTNDKLSTFLKIKKIKFRVHGLGCFFFSMSKHVGSLSPRT